MPACLPALHAALLQELRLDARRILINGGQLLIGSPEAPYVGSAVVTLHGDRSDTELPIYGTKCIGVRVRSCGSLPDSLLAAFPARRPSRHHTRQRPCDRRDLR